MRGMRRPTREDPISGMTKPTPTSPSGPGTLWKFSFSDRKAMPFAGGVTGLDVTPDGSKALIAHGPSLQIVSTMAPAVSSANSSANCRCPRGHGSHWWSRSSFF